MGEWSPRGIDSALTLTDNTPKLRGRSNRRGFQPSPLFLREAITLKQGHQPVRKKSLCPEGAMLAEEILLVNDGSVLLKMIGGLLESKGYALHLTDSPEEAQELLSSRNIMLVVMKKVLHDGPDRLRPCFPPAGNPQQN